LKEKYAFLSGLLLLNPKTLNLSRSANSYDFRTPHFWRRGIILLKKFENPSNCETINVAELVRKIRNSPFTQ
jgi:hypothetical protein